MVKTIKLQIYDATETEIEYDNTAEDIDWGIVAGSILLDRPFMTDELKFGQLNSTRLEFQLFGLDLDLTGRYIELSVEQSVTDSSHLITDNNENIVTDNGILIDVGSETTYEWRTIFRGWIDSCKRDHSNIDRIVIAYDWLYFHRDDNVADLWNELWDSVLPSHQIGRIMQIFIDEYTPFVDSGIDYWGTTGVLVNWGMLVYSDMVPHPISYITLEQVFNMCSELMNVSPYIEPNSNTMRWAKLGTCSEDITDPKPPINVTGNLEGENSAWETYETQTITGVGIYDSDSNLMQLVGTEDNVYKVVGNIFMINQPADVATRIANNMLTELSTYTYTPCSLKLIESEISTRPGQAVVTDMGNSYVMHYTLSGALLIDEIMDAYAKSPYLNKDVRSINQEFITAYKISKVEQTVDGIETEIANLKDGSSTTISQLANAVIVRLNSNGQFAEAKLIDDGTGGTAFKVTADNIDFIANNTMQLTTKNLGITSTNFSVTPAGSISAKLGDIAGWTITTNAIYNTMTVSGVDYSTILSSSSASGAAGFAFSVSKTENGITTYPVVIRYNGKVECSNILATGGVVGGWTVTANTIYKEVTVSGVTYSTTLSSTTSGGENGFAFSVSRTENGTTTYPVVIRNSGKFECTDGSFKGAVNTTSLKIDNQANLSIATRTITETSFDIYPTYVTVVSSAISANVLQISSGYGLYIPDVTEFGSFVKFDSGIQSDTLQCNAFYTTGSAYVTGWVHAGGLEIKGGTPFIDFHMGLQDDTDFTCRVCQRATDTLDYLGHDSSTWGILRAAQFAVQSSKYVKENIETISEDEAKKVLKLNPVKFDYISGDKNQRGLIAEEVQRILPEMVNVPDGYEEFNPDEPWNTPSIDYSKFVPYLIKMIQMQQKEIDSILNKNNV